MYHVVMVTITGYVRYRVGANQSIWIIPLSTDIDTRHIVPSFRVADRRATYATVEVKHLHGRILPLLTTYIMRADGILVSYDAEA